MRYDIGAALAGLVAILLGVAFLLEALDVAEFRFGVLLPLAAIVVGAGAILSVVLSPDEP